MTTSRTVAWVKEDPFGVEFVQVDLGPERLSAAGVAIGTDPALYRLDYKLETQRQFITRRLRVETRADGWTRRLDLARDRAGAWSLTPTATGEAPLPPIACDPDALQGALDCDLGLSPLTNSMPVLRHGLLHGGAIDFKMAWVSVPDLSVHVSEQRYTFLRTEGDRHIVRFEDSDSFTADLVFDGDGLVVDYPGLARRLP